MGVNFKYILITCHWLTLVFESEIIKQLFNLTLSNKITINRTTETFLMTKKCNEPPCVYLKFEHRDPNTSVTDNAITPITVHTRPNITALNARNKEGKAATHGRPRGACAEHGLLWLKIWCCVEECCNIEVSRRPSLRPRRSRVWCRLIQYHAESRWKVLIRETTQSDSYIFDK